MNHLISQQSCHFNLQLLQDHGSTVKTPFIQVGNEEINELCKKIKNLSIFDTKRKFHESATDLDDGLEFYAKVRKSHWFDRSDDTTDKIQGQALAFANADWLHGALRAGNYNLAEKIKLKFQISGYTKEQVEALLNNIDD
jgi:hypothetical protein